jgi:hypothetical protein
MVKVVNWFVPEPSIAMAVTAPPAVVVEASPPSTTNVPPVPPDPLSTLPTTLNVPAVAPNFCVKFAPEAIEMDSKPLPFTPIMSSIVTVPPVLVTDNTPNPSVLITMAASTACADVPANKIVIVSSPSSGCCLDNLNLTKIDAMATGVRPPGA